MYRPHYSPRRRGGTSVPINRLASAVAQRLGAPPQSRRTRRPNQIDRVASAVVARLSSPRPSRAASLPAPALASAIARRITVRQPRPVPASAIASAVARRLQPARRPSSAGYTSSPTMVASAVARRLGLRRGQTLASAVARPMSRRLPVSAIASAIATRLAPLAEQQQGMETHDESAGDMGVKAESDQQAN